MDDQIARLLLLAEADILTGVERGIAYGTPALRVRGKFLARMKDATTLVIRCPLWEKAMLMETEPEFYFETDHYSGHAAMLVHLHVIDDARLTARLEAAWKMQAGNRMITAREVKLKRRELPGG